MNKKFRLGLLISTIVTHSSLPSFAMQDQEELGALAHTLLPPSTIVGDQGESRISQTFFQNSFGQETVDSLRKIQAFRKSPEELSGCEFFFCGLSDEDAPMVAALLSQASHLTTLNLSINKLTSYGFGQILNAISE